MKRLLSLFAVTALATALVANTSITVAAQEPVPAARVQMQPQAAEAEPANIEAIIVKYVQPEQYSVLDAQMTTQAADAAEAPVAPMRVLTPDAIQTLSAQAGVQLTFQREMSDGAYVLALPQAAAYTEAAHISKQIAALGEVDYAEPDGRRAIALTPDDPRYAEQWHYFAPVTGTYGANLSAAWDIITGSANIVVAVVDTGIRFDHPDLAGRIVTGTASGQRGYDFVTNIAAGNDGQTTTATNSRDPDPSDPGDWCGGNDSSWHGTHVAGTIGANSNNGVGVAGVNWVSKILTIRGLGKCGGSVSDIVDGMRWAAGLSVPGLPANPNPARVVNMSLGSTQPEACSSTEQNAITELFLKGVVVVVAAGNENGQAGAYSPGNCNRVITVGATNRLGSRASYSNFGTRVDISGPGGITTIASDPNGILSTLNAGTTIPTGSIYEFYQGTSMATPHVAGVVSLMLSVNPNLNPTQVLNILKSTATPFPAGSTCTTANCGAGILNAAGAVQSSQGTTGVPYKSVYLPVAINQTSSPPPSGGGPLKNGDFEQGDMMWIAQTLQGVPLIVDTPEITRSLPQAKPHSGDWAAWLGGFNSEVASISQVVTVPSNATYLTYWQLISSNETASDCDLDIGRVLVSNVTVAGSVTGLCATSNTYPNWQKKSLNLSAYAGQTVTLAFDFRSDSSVFSSWLLDDIAFSATP
jgi:serine protease